MSSHPKKPRRAPRGTPAMSKSRSSTNEFRQVEGGKRTIGGQNMRSATTIRRLRMYNTKPKRNKKGKVGRAGGWWGRTRKRCGAHLFFCFLPAPSFFFFWLSEDGCMGYSEGVRRGCLGAT